MGTPADLRKQISAALPATDWSDPSWGRLDSPDAWLEFNLGNDEDCTSLTIHARGNAYPFLSTLMSATGWRALDTGSGKWALDTEDLRGGQSLFHKFLESIRRFR